MDRALTGDEVPFAVAVENGAAHTLVSVAGEVDVFTAPRLRQVLFDPALCSRARVVVDLAGVTFMDSTGIGTLVAARRWTMSRDTALALVAPPGPVQRLLELVGLQQVFEVHDAVEDAVEAAT